MPKGEHPLKVWMRDHAFGCDYERLALLLPSQPTGESIRHVANGHRPPGWDLAFELEAITKIPAKALRDERLYVQQPGRTP